MQQQDAGTTSGELTPLMSSKGVLVEISHVRKWSMWLVRQSHGVLVALLGTPPMGYLILGSS
jgi:hypothetical protein